MMQSRKSVRAMAIGVAAVAISAGGVLTMAQQGGPEQGHQGGQPDIGAMLIGGLQQSPGCLGVDAGQMMSGKSTIFAWFENKKAVEEWYYSTTHMRAMKMFIKGDVDHEPLTHVKDADTPILVIASLTPSTHEELEQVGMPISQIAIELYAPLPGGAFINSRFAPEGFDVAHMQDLTGPDGE